MTTKFKAALSILTLCAGAACAMTDPLALVAIGAIGIMGASLTLIMGE